MGRRTLQPRHVGAAQGGGSPSRRESWLALRRLARGGQQAMLYEQDHPGFAAALQLAFDGCCELLALFPTCTLQLVPVGLTLMGESLSSEGSIDRLGERLRERRIPAVTFLAGTTKQELLELFRLLDATPESVEAQGGAETWLKHAGVRSILLEAPRSAPSYQTAWESFVAAQQSTDRTALAELLSLCPEHCRGTQQEDETGCDEEGMLAWLVEALGGAAATLSQEPSGREEWLRQALRAVRGLTPGLQRRLFRVRPRHESDVLGEIAHLLAPEEAAELLVGYPNAVVGETSEQLESVLRRLMPDRERARQVEPLAKEALLSRGMTEESYTSVVSLVLRRNLDPVTPPVSLRDTRGHVRRASLLTDIISSVSARGLLETRLEMLLELIASPGEWEGRERLATQLAELLADALSELAGDRAADLVQRVEEAITSRVLPPPERRLLRSHLTGALSPDLCWRIASFVLGEPSEENATVLRAISRAEDGFGALLRVAAEASLPWLQAAAGSAILSMGERSVESCHQTLRSGVPQEAAGLARALILSGAREGLERGLRALEHPDAAAVAGLMEALAHSRDETAELVLLESLRDGLPEVQSAAALSLGRHPSDRAVAALSSLLAGRFALRRIELVKSAITALGQIGRAECVPPLRAVLRRRSLFRPRQTRELQALAGEALAAIPDPAAEQILREAARGGRSELSGLCRRALELRQSVLRSERGHVADR